MNNHYFSADNTADLAKWNIKNILKNGIKEQRKVGSWSMKKDGMMEMIETNNIVLELTNPKNCISSQHCLGCEIETEDYFLGLNPGFVHLSPWSFYKRWINSDTGKYDYTYGERGGQWIFAVIEKLKHDSTSRQIIINLWDKEKDFTKKFVPCTTQWLFYIQNNKLYMTTTMRSQDALRGFFLDTFAYPLIMQFIAKSLNIEMGTYTHIIVNSHIYHNDIEFAKKILSILQKCKPLEIDLLSLDQMILMQQISEKVFWDRNIQEAEKMLIGLPKFWKLWKMNQLIYIYTKYIKNHPIPTELTVDGVMLHVKP